MYFNKNRFDEAGIAYPYQTVIDGKWTLDTMTALIKDTYQDVNGDGTAGKEDVYGLVSENFNQLWAFMDPMNVKVFDKDSSDRITFVMDSEHNASVVEKLRTLWSGNTNVFRHNDEQTPADIPATMFVNGKALITAGDIGHTDHYRELSFEYGILPYPKWDESQQEYITRTSSAISIFCIPVSAQKPEMTAAVLEAMNSETYRSVIPAYYETALKVKYSRDSETVRVLDILREDITMQFVDVYSTVFSNLNGIFRTVLHENKGTWSSDVAAVKESAITKLNDLIAYYEK